MNTLPLQRERVHRSAVESTRAPLTITCDRFHRLSFTFSFNPSRPVVLPAHFLCCTNTRLAVNRLLLDGELYHLRAVSVQ